MKTNLTADVRVRVKPATSEDIEILCHLKDKKASEIHREALQVYMRIHRNEIESHRAEFNLATIAAQSAAAAAAKAAAKPSQSRRGSKGKL